MVVVVDDEGRENEGDLTMAAELVTPEAVNFMAREGRGLICLALESERCEQLGLSPMTARNESAFQTAFTVSIEARDGVTTGISAADRAHTIRVACDPASPRRALVQPGHVFPLKARAGGVLQRPGQTEAAVDLARLAGLQPAGVICEIMNDDGTMARVPDLGRFCREHDLRMVSVADLVRYLRAHHPLVERVVSTPLPTRFGDFEATGYRSRADGAHHVALVHGDIGAHEEAFVRVHVECLNGHVFRSLQCDCRQDLESSLAAIGRRGAGVLLYLSPERRRVTPPGMPCAERAAGAREQGIASEIMADLGLPSLRLLAA
jgi:3,4-dihydroxy 2-butanone 4-phosphate synthase/GTP cyclohydrolase II